MGEKFHGSLNLSLCRENVHGFSFDKDEKQLLHIAILALKMVLIKLIGKLWQLVENLQKPWKFSPV